MHKNLKRIFILINKLIIMNKKRGIISLLIEVNHYKTIIILKITYFQNIIIKI